MDDAIALLDGVASRKQVLGVVVFNLSERPVFALLLARSAMMVMATWTYA